MMNKPEWKVTVQQKCHCSFTNVKVRCPGFDSVVKPSPFIISKSGPDLCLLDYGNSIRTFHFTYGSDQPIAFVPYSFVENCSWMNELLLIASLIIIKPWRGAEIFSVLINYWKLINTIMLLLYVECFYIITVFN